MKGLARGQFTNTSKNLIPIRRISISAITDAINGGQALSFGYGHDRVFDHIFIERLWRTVKYDDIYIKEYASVLSLVVRLQDYFQLYNYERPHQSLGYQAPVDALYADRVPILLPDNPP